METKIIKGFIDPAKDYREVIDMWKVNKDGDLVWVKNKYGHNKSYYIITKERLNEEDWLSHMNEKMDAAEFGQFVCAYFKACEMAGIKELKVELRGFNLSYKFSDEE